MAKNIRHTKAGNVCLALAVTAGNASGNVVPLGTAGLRGLLLTNRATTALINSGEAAPGLANGEATVELIGVSTVVDLAVAGAVAQYARVYATYATGVPTYDATGTHFIGYALEAAAGADTIKVALLHPGSNLWGNNFSPFVSAETTGTGATQNVAHGLGYAPTKVIVAVTEGDGNAFDVAEGTHTTTNVVLTVTSGVKFKVLAF